MPFPPNSDMDGSYHKSTTFLSEIVCVTYSLLSTKENNLTICHILGDSAKPDAKRTCPGWQPPDGIVATLLLGQHPVKGDVNRIRVVHEVGPNILGNAQGRTM